MKVNIGPYPYLYNEQLDLFDDVYLEIKEQTVEVQLDNYDTWNMDKTLGYIVLPMLKQLQKTKMGSPFVDDEDVPKHLRSNIFDENDPDDTHHRRWDYVLNEIIFAFESLFEDWEDKFWIVKPKLDWDSVPDEGGIVNWLQAGELDVEGRNQYQKRIDNGFLMFGKYYQSLWD